MRKFSELSEKEKLKIRTMVETYLVLTCYFSLLISILLSIVVPVSKAGLAISIVWFIINIIASLVSDEVPIFLRIGNLIFPGYFIYYIFINW